MSPRSMTVTLETVTPLLSSGADGRTPELRPPPFRGMMRYWFRAMTGGAIGDQNLTDLKKLETAVFGSPDVGSPIGVRLKPRNLQTCEAFILPHKKKGRRKGLDATFDLVLAQPRKQSPEVWEAARASLLLALTFGGVGLRARRGYGTLRVTGGDAPPFPTTLEGWKSLVEEVATSAIQAAKALATACGVPVTGLPQGPTQYPCANKSGLVRLCNLQAISAMEAVIRFMKRVPKPAWLGGIRPRQASPLWIRPINAENGYGLLAVVLASDFRGSNYQALEDFLEGFAGSYLKIKGWNL